MAPAPRLVPVPSGDLAEAVDELYAVAPPEFVATRTVLVARARAGGDRDLARAIGVLRRPSVAAWAMNVAARGEPAVVGELARVGGRMRQAQSRLDMTAVGALRGERDAAVEGYVAACVRVAVAAGRPLAASAVDECRQSAVAALASEVAAAAVVSGRLTTALTYTGFGDVDVSEALALLPPTANVRQPDGITTGLPDVTEGPTANVRQPDGITTGLPDVREEPTADVRQPDGITTGLPDVTEEVPEEVPGETPEAQGRRLDEAQARLDRAADLVREALAELDAARAELDRLRPAAPAPAPGSAP